MNDVNDALADVASNMNTVSDFIEDTKSEVKTAAAADGAGVQSPAPVEPVKRGRGRPKGSGSKKSTSTVWQGAKPDTAATAGKDLADVLDQGEDLEEAKRKFAAKYACQLVQTSGYMLAGEDGKMDKDEQLTVEDAFSRYFEAKGVVDFPPGIALALALGGYYARRLATEKAQPKVYLAIYGIKNIFRRFIGLFKKSAPAPAAA